MDNTIIASDDKVGIRRLRDEDLEYMVMYANNTNVSKNLRDSFPNPYTMKDAVTYQKMINWQKMKTNFIIEFEGWYVGNIGLVLGADIYRKSAELGYFIGEPFWGKGITTKAVNLITKWGFNQLDIVRIHAGVFDFNKASQRVLEKCGYTLECIAKKAVVKESSLIDEYRYVKLKDGL